MDIIPGLLLFIGGLALFIRGFIWRFYTYNIAVDNDHPKHKEKLRIVLMIGGFRELKTLAWLFMVIAMPLIILGILLILGK